MEEKKAAVEKLWARQQILESDVDYDFWDEKRESLIRWSRFSPGCLFAVDVFKGIYDFASDHFADLFGYNPDRIRTIRKQGDLLDDRIHPADRDQLLAFQLEHGQFIYSLPPEQRNDYQQTFQMRIRNAKQEYVNVISRQQVFQQDKNGKAWMIVGVMDLSPDQSCDGTVKRTVLNRKTGEIVRPSHSDKTTVCLTKREKEILQLIRQGLLSKEIADRLGISIHTVHNHRKHLLARLQANNSLEAIRYADRSGIWD